ncbi:outer membrane protein for export and assembly of type 1 fimbriae [Klebsiella variicola]|nr:outer membrane protein for export and assembly of type 1 fimbriae [Klebsiella variicola]
MPSCPMPPSIAKNRIALDTNTLADNVDLDDAVVSVVPTHGAIVRANFNAQVGMKILMTLTHRGKTGAVWRPRHRRQQPERQHRRG